MNTFEKMPCRYDVNDISNRLHGTICRYKDQPVYVYFDGVNPIKLKHPVTMEYIAEIRFDDPDFDISSPELGYMNLVIPMERDPKVRVIYVEREPKKRYRQGLCSTHLTYSDLGGSENIHIPGYPAEHYLRNPGFYDMLVGTFPNLDEAFVLLEDGEGVFGSAKVLCTQVAISKDTALEKTKSGVYQVYFKCDNVGWMAPGTRTVNVKSSEMGWIISRYLQVFSWKIE